jgi:hypothetical protein
MVWKDRSGVDRFVNGKTVDVSPTGIRVEIADPIDKQTYVTLRCVGLGLQGAASVRSCTRKGLKYLVGLEFSAGLQWKPKDSTPLG